MKKVLTLTIIALFAVVSNASAACPNSDELRIKLVSLAVEQAKHLEYSKDELPMLQQCAEALQADEVLGAQLAEVAARLTGSSSKGEY